MSLDPNQLKSSSRETCQTCFRPLNVCYCDALVKINSKIKILIIQHPLEENHPFNTGRMTSLCLTNCELVVAETLSSDVLTKILNSHSHLLYPSLDWLPESDINHSDNSTNKKASIDLLIVIDATWRKSKKILHLNPNLQTLPRLSLTGDLESNYQIRKTTITNGLSTIESIVQAMNQLEPEGNFELLLKPFNKMIELQLSNKPKSKYAINIAN